MATYVKFHAFVENLCEQKFNFTNTASAVITVALTATTPDAAADAVLADLPTPIAYTNLSSRAVLIASSGQSGGTYSLVLTDLVLTASGVVPTFRYVTHYADAAAADELIQYYDHGSNVDLAASETYTIDYGAALFTLA